ncbi:hypothetical protein ACFQUU_14445 [Herbaspirillum sp. GCM10030257]|uniref:hypothetical protein n=1 Tax=Herbaspirillum sp. GCM10030257 TaxID=3273393 RepID=UPI003608942D
MWQDILHENGLDIPGYQGKHVVGYRQSMGRYGVSTEHFRAYWVKKGLSIAQKQSVALSIFMEVSLGFESMQEQYSWLTNSGYSEEDLVSNLVGFYIEVLGVNWVSACKPVSQKAAQAVWDGYGSVGSHKNRAFKPNLYPCEECKGIHRIVTPTFPSIFQSIQPARKGKDYNEAGKDMPLPKHLQSALYRQL